MRTEEFHLRIPLLPFNTEETDSTNIPTLHLPSPSPTATFSQKPRSIRLQGPTITSVDDLNFVKFLDEVCGRSVSNYPYGWAVKEGQLVLDYTQRMGDPICDYFAIQR